MSKPIPIRGEILPPLPQSLDRSQPSRLPEAASDEHLNLIATWLDDRFEIPGTRIRFGLDALLGSIPSIGDIAHVAWKANRRNYNLLIRDPQSRRRHTWQDCLFVVAAALIMILLFLAPFVLLVYLFKSQRPLH